MQNFTAHRLRFVTEVQSTIELNEHQGSAIRGSLFHALRNQFCAYRKADECAGCPLVATCPVATLVSTLKPGGKRGRDVPRPYTIQPPLWAGSEEPGAGSCGHPVEFPDGRVVFRYEPRERFEFGLTLYAQALQLFPYVILAVHQLEEGGIGRRTEQLAGRWRRGTFAVREVWAENPLTGERQQVLNSGDQLVQVPDIPITHRQVMEKGRMKNEKWRIENEEWRIKNGEWRMENGEKRITLRLLTPARIIERGHLLKPHQFRFRPFLQRLLERLESLSGYFSDTPLDVDFPALLEQAEAVRVVDNWLNWEELRSYSTRQHRATPLGGLVGKVTLEAKDWTPFLPWLVWGQFVHVGKDAVKGNGWYRMDRMMNEEW